LKSTHLNELAALLAQDGGGTRSQKPGAINDFINKVEPEFDAFKAQFSQFNVFFFLKWLDGFFLQIAGSTGGGQQLWFPKL
jgi:hypothetical protein